MRTFTYLLRKRGKPSGTDYDKWTTDDRKLMGHDITRGHTRTSLRDRIRQKGEREHKGTVYKEGETEGQ